jgi:hypothetical protein
MKSDRRLKESDKNIDLENDINKLGLKLEE